MGFKTEHKIDPNFNMSSMTDMIFLLLIFFLLTSNFVTPSGLPIDTPTSKAGQKIMPEINVGITKNGEYYVNEVKTDLGFMEDYLADMLRERVEENRVVVISIDKDAPTRYLVNVAGMVAKLKAKTVISVKPE
jgi:biopolymer transport protein ExbD